MGSAGSGQSDRPAISVDNKVIPLYRGFGKAHSSLSGGGF